MLLTRTEGIPAWRVWLVLGRVSNLPTVWSNCLAGWWLGGGENWAKLLLLCLGASCLYLGGMFLNDAFDADADRQLRTERPIPAGAVSPETVWQLGFGWLVLGLFLLIFLGRTATVLALLLVVAIVIYDAVHKVITFSSVLMAFCRFLLFLLAASAGVEGVTGIAIWSGLALAGYIIGLSELARKESVRGPLRYWPCCWLAVPLPLALIVNNGDYRKWGIVFSMILGLWVYRSLRSTFWSPERNVVRTVSGLLAGIVLVDWLAVAGATPGVGILYALLFLAALLAQRFIPAT